jgi:hypothetical protein
MSTTTTSTLKTTTTPAAMSTYIHQVIAPASVTGNGVLANARLDVGAAALRKRARSAPGEVALSAVQSPSEAVAQDPR